MKIQIIAKPNSKQQKNVESADGTLIIRLKSPPVYGKANREPIEVLAQKYGVSPSQIAIKSGLNGRYKIIEIN